MGQRARGVGRRGAGRRAEGLREDPGNSEDPAQIGGCELLVVVVVVVVVVVMAGLECAPLASVFEKA